MSISPESPKVVVAAVVAVVAVVAFFDVTTEPIVVDPLDIESPVPVNKDVYEPGELVVGSFSYIRRVTDSSTLIRSLHCSNAFYPQAPVELPGGRVGDSVGVDAPIMELRDIHGEPIRPAERCHFRFTQQFVIDGRIQSESYQTVEFKVRHAS